ncbi:MAG: Flp pilus assembly protein CpaB [Bryobacteraceae bacterium]
MDRRILIVAGVSLLFALVVSSIFYQMSSRAGGGSRQQSKTEIVDLVVAAQPLPVGVQIKPGDLKVVRVPKDRVPAGSFQKIEEVVGRPVVSNILLDEPVIAGRLAERGSGFGLAPVIPPGMRAVAVKVNEVVGVAGFVLPGMRVDVLVTVRPPGEGGARTSTILQNVPVVSAGKQIQADSSGNAVNAPVVTLLVTPEQAEILTLAGNEGRIQLVLRNSADLALSKPPGRAMTELYGPRAVERPPVPVRRTVVQAAAAPPPAPAPPPPEEVVVIRGTERSVELIGGGKSN